MLKLYFSHILFVIFIFFSINVSCQTEGETIKEVHEKEAHKKHTIGFALTHTSIGSGIKNNIGDQWISFPSFTLDYSYYLNRKWLIGLHNDVILEEFIVEDKRPNLGEDEIIGIERSKPITTTLVFGYKIVDHIILIAGGGMEFSKEESFKVVRFGIDAPFEIRNNWEIFGTFTYDIKIDAYDAFFYGLGIAKLF